MQHEYGNRSVDCRMKKQDNTLIIVLAVIIALFLFSGFGMMGYGGYGMMGMMGYGNNYLCSTAGGIWCYIPIWGLFFMLLFWVVIALLVVWVARTLQNGRKR